MVCEQYKKDLSEAAAGCGLMSAELGEHVQGCPRCRAALANELALFAAIDANLHQRANGEPSTSLAGRVRAAISVAPDRKRRWVHGWVPVAASILFIAGVGAWNRRHQEALQHNAPVTVASDRPSRTNSEAVGRKGETLSVPRPARIVRPTSMGNIDFRPLVPDGQRVEVDRLIEGIRSGQIDGKVLLVNARENLEIAPMVIPPIVPDSPDAESEEPRSNSGVPVSEALSETNRRAK